MEERIQIINELQEKAEKVLSLKNERRQKRPIVIEFSGSPKSGKTSCINSLELFLKRNGFTVKTIQERAGVCPVTDKRNPMFNIWTACASLAGMIGTLENKNSEIDVLILDRGIYDSLCWFNWLVKKGKMEVEQQKRVEDFLLMKDLVNPIDIVFSFVASPETSISREYTNLLTNKLGSIMNKTVLQEYKDSIEEVAQTKKQYFHKVFVIDTTDKSQDLVGKEVTEKTLEALKELLVEKIGVIKKGNELKRIIDQGGVFEYFEIADELKSISFVSRDVVESDNEYIQPIPIAVFTNRARTEILVIKKNSKAVSDNSPEKGKTLLYVGGHTRYEDSSTIDEGDFLSLCRSTLKREVKEEIGISIALSNMTPFVIYTPDTDISKNHIGICFVIEQDNEDLHLRLDSKELVQKKGTTKSGTFQRIEDLKNETMESWSNSILDYYFESKHVDKQVSIFDKTVRNQ